MDILDAAAMRAQDAAYVAAVIKEYPWLAPHTDDGEGFDKYPRRVTVKQQEILSVACEVAAKHGVPIELLIGTSCSKRIAHIRHEAYWVCYFKLGHSYTSIGRVFRKDHASVIYGVKKYQERLNATIPG